MFPIGKLVDSADDMARLMIVTQYAGSKTVKVYSQGDNRLSRQWARRRVTSPSTDDGLNHGRCGNRDVNNVPLKSEGTYYPGW